MTFPSAIPPPCPAVSAARRLVNGIMFDCECFPAAGEWHPVNVVWPWLSMYLNVRSIVRKKALFSGENSIWAQLLRKNGGISGEVVARSISSGGKVLIPENIMMLCASYADSATNLNIGGSREKCPIICGDR